MEAEGLEHPDLLINQTSRPMRRSSQLSYASKKLMREPGVEPQIARTPCGGRVLYR
jgi:hypothetical protein